MKAPVLSVVAALAVAVAVFVVAGDDEGGPGAGDAERYCEISRELDEIANERAEELATNLAPTPAELRQAELELLEENVVLFSELIDAAPEQIAPDVGLTVELLRIRAGLSAETFTPQEIRAAEEAVQQFEEESCPKP